MNGTHKKWRGAELVVRQLRGRGGKSGLRYEIRIDSLPLDVQRRLNALSTDVEPRLSHGAKAQAERDWWYGVIQPALQFDRYSKERGQAIDAIAGRRHMQPNGTWRTISKRTIQRKIEKFESAKSLSVLSRAKRADAGTPRVVVTRTWDNAVPLDEAIRRGVAADLLQYVRSLHKAGEAPQSLQVLASRKLRLLTVEAGFDPGRNQLEAICRVPMNRIRAENVYRNVRRFKSDRKAYEDARPRINRTRRGLAPMDIIVGDVHPIDILVRREDGSIATPKAIAWQDLATNRIWMDAVLLDKSKGVRNCHVIGSFINMAQAWGAPNVLYLDNGGEYNCAEFIDDALKLKNCDGERAIDRVMRDSHIVRAQPYNAAAKPIEGIFALLERNHFSRIPGWIGGERMKKKTANAGREPEPSTYTFDELIDVISASVRYYEHMPQRGALKGRSPRQALAAAIDQGWGMTQVHPDAFALAFSTEEPRQVRQGSVRCLGRRWTCRELQAYQRERVSVLIPKYQNWSKLPIRDDAGQLLGIAEPDEPFAFLDPAGATEADARAKVHKQGVSALDRSARDIDPLAERAAFLSEQPAAPIAPIVGRIGPSDEAVKILGGLRETTDQRIEREGEEQSRKLARQLDRIEQHQRKTGNDT